jgi:hypothetical protein
MVDPLFRRLWTGGFGYQSGQYADNRLLSRRVEVLPDDQFLTWVLRFGPKDQLAFHIFSPLEQGWYPLVLED